MVIYDVFAVFIITQYFEIILDTKKLTVLQYHPDCWYFIHQVFKWNVLRPVF